MPTDTKRLPAPDTSICPLTLQAIGGTENRSLVRVFTRKMSDLHIITQISLWQISKGKRRDDRLCTQLRQVCT